MVVSPALSMMKMEMNWRFNYKFIDQMPLIKIQAGLEAHKELLIRDGIAARNGVSDG